MKLYLVKRTDRIGYDTYDGYVCVAKDEKGAMSVAPGKHFSPKHTTIKYLGEYAGSGEGEESTVVLASFNAG